MNMHFLAWVENLGGGGGSRPGGISAQLGCGVGACGQDGNSTLPQLFPDLGGDLGLIQGFRVWV